LSKITNLFCICEQIDQICEELGQNLKELIEVGKSGVVASLLAACQRLETNRREVSLFFIEKVQINSSI
jgi:hypothetical protein